MTKTTLKTYLRKRKRNREWLNSSLGESHPLYMKTFTPQSEIRCLGYEGARDMGILEVYKDACGLSFGRDVDFESKHPSLKPQKM